MLVKLLPFNRSPGECQQFLRHTFVASHDAS
jgi:hypothetical protein